MKKLILLALLFISVYASAQIPGYTTINSRYEWLAGKFRALNLPYGCGYPSLQPGQYQGSGAIYLDTCFAGGRGRVYYRHGTTWQAVLDSTTIAGLIAAAGGGNINQSTVGTMYVAKTWSNTNDFIDRSSGVSIVSNKLNFSAGTNAYTNTLGWKVINGLEKWTIGGKVTINAKASDSYGFGFGSRSTNAAGGSYATQAMFAFDVSTGSNSGKLTFNAGGGSYSTILTSATAMSFSSGDQILISVERDREIWKASIRNLTTGLATDTVSLTYLYPYNSGPPYGPNTGELSIYNLGGSSNNFTIDSFYISSSEIKYPSFFVGGDSKASGGNVTSRDSRFVTLMNNGLGSTVVNAGQGDKTVDFKAAQTQIINFVKPKVAMLTAFSNDIRQGVSSSVWQANYDTIVKRFHAAGIPVYHMLPFKENLNQSAWTAWIQATYSADSIIDTWTVTNECSGCVASDNIHPSDIGHYNIYKAIEAKGLPGANAAGQEAVQLRNQYNVPQNFSAYISGPFRSADSVVANAIRTVNGASFYNGKLAIKNIGYLSSPYLESSSYLTFKTLSDITIFEGGTTTSNRPVLQLSTSGAQTVSGELRGFNNNSGNSNTPFKIYTAGFANGSAGDITLTAGATVSGGGVPTGGLFGNYHIFLIPSGKVKMKPNQVTSATQVLIYNPSDSSFANLPIDSLNIPGGSGSGINVYNSDGYTGNRTVKAIGEFNINAMGDTTDANNQAYVRLDAANNTAKIGSLSSGAGVDVTADDGTLVITDTRGTKDGAVYGGTYDFTNPLSIPSRAKVSSMINDSLNANAKTIRAAQRTGYDSLATNFGDTALVIKAIDVQLNGAGVTETITDTSIRYNVVITKSDVGLGNVDNTSDATKNSATATLTNKTLTAPVISSIVNTGTLTLPTVTGTITQYVTNSTASSSTPAPTGDARDNRYSLTALATAPTFSAPSGTATDGNTLLIRIKDNGTARALTWNAIYRGGTQLALPTTTTISKTMYVQFVYNSADTKWDLVGLTDGL